MSIDFVYDIETGATESGAVICSAAMIAVDFERDFTYDELLSSAKYVKFDGRAQVNAGRVVDADTMKWWSEQDPEVRRKQCVPSTSDVSLKEGFDDLRAWMLAKGMTNQSVIWTRGELDSMVTSHAIKSVGIAMLFPFWRVRDVRTAIDILYNSNNGYCKTSVAIPNTATKHDPVHDCCIDAMMLKYGVEI